jgi:VWFA-related protein
MRVLLAACLWLAVGAALPATDDAAARRLGSSSRLDAEPRTVVFDVIATDGRGRPIENLTSPDFELHENGALQSIDDVRFVKTPPRGIVLGPGVPIETDVVERMEAARPDARLFAFFLDEYHVSAVQSERVRAAVKQFVDETARPTDLFVVMRPLDSLLTIRMTRDRDQIQRAIEAFEGRLGDYTPRNSYERNYLAGDPARIDRVRAQVTTSALDALAIHLGSLNRAARKALVVVSEGLPRAERRRGLEGLPTVESVSQSANRANVSVYAVDPRPAHAEAEAAGHAESLRLLSDATDGQTIAGEPDLAAAMRRIAADSSAYYLLVYRSTQRHASGFYEVGVGVRKAGVRVRARKGYWASALSDRLPAGSPIARPVPALDPPRRISPLINPWFGSSRGAGARTRVTFVWEPSARVLGTRGTQPRAARIVLNAVAADGTPVFEGAVWPTGPLRDDDATRRAAVFETPPGLLQLRMSIEDETAQRIDSDVRQITVRDLTRPVALGTPEVFRARTARDVRALASGANAAPVASRSFSRAERLIIRVPAYGPSDAPLSLSGHLLSRLGQAMRALATEWDAATSLARIDLPLAGLATGDYQVEITAKSGVHEARELLEFRVTP